MNKVAYVLHGICLCIAFDSHACSEVDSKSEMEVYSLRRSYSSSFVLEPSFGSKRTFQRLFRAVGLVIIHFGHLISQRGTILLVDKEWD